MCWAGRQDARSRRNSASRVRAWQEQRGRCVDEAGSVLLWWSVLSRCGTTSGAARRRQVTRLFVPPFFYCGCGNCPAAIAPPAQTAQKSDRKKRRKHGIFSQDAQKKRATISDRLCASSDWGGGGDSRTLVFYALITILCHAIGCTAYERRWLMAGRARRPEIGERGGLEPASTCRSSADCGR